ITINKSKVSGGSDLSSFPVLINMTDSTLATTANGGKAASGSGEFVFTSSNGTTVLPHEIETYSATTGQFIGWVNVTTLSATDDTYLYIYYGGPAAGTKTNQRRPETWDTNYKSVWHLPNGTTLTAGDSTSNINTGTITGTVTAENGKVDGAAGFSGAATRYILGANTVNTSSATVSAWVNLKAIPVGNGLVGGFCQGYGCTIDDKLIIITSTGGMKFYVFDGSGKNTGTSGSIGTNTWAYLVGTADGTTAYSYVNGVRTGSVAAGATYTGYGGANIMLGGYAATNAPEILNAHMDEYRISNTARSAAWIKTEYNNQFKPALFYNVGGLENRTAQTVKIGQTTTSRDTPSGWYNSGGTWDYRRKITIDKSKVSGTANLSNFPVLVNVTYPDLRTTGFSGKLASGSGEFVFTSSDGTTSLPYEIETYSSSSGQFIGWVNVTTLSVTQDTAIYMYYGGPSAGAATNQNKTGTWDSNYKGVWHLGNGTTLSLVDTIGNNNLTNSGTTATSGQIDGGEAFSGTSQLASKTVSVVNIPATNANTTLSAWFTIGVADANTRTGLTFTDGTQFLGFGQRSSGVVFNKNFGDALGGSQANPAINTFHYMVLTWDGTTNRPYYDGVAIGTNTTSHDIGTPTKIYFSTWNGANEMWNGKFDEVRISDVVRSADWIKTEYNNQSKPRLFYAVGGLEKRN
ncbi:MAG: DUF2341 domain-containing protein, partial [bacterium]|nr:DUF2341 domain-containing protein [bacterium]